LAYEPKTVAPAEHLWSIENQPHWQLDVTFGEDRARMHKDNSPLNWNVMRRAALPLLHEADLGKKTSIKRKMFMAALDVQVFEKIIQKNKCFCSHSTPTVVS